MNDELNGVAFGYKALDERTEPLIPYLRGWRTAINRYIAVHEGEPPYYFNERASLSMLAAGAWLSGATALEEYGTYKGWGSSKGNGRCDLYISDHEKSAEIEAKQKWMSAATSDASLAAHIQAEVKKASAEAKRNYDADTKFGCVFFVPRFSKTRFRDYPSSPERFIKAEIGRYLKAAKIVHLWAWCFPTETRTVLGGHSMNSYYPGVILAFRGEKYWP